MKPTQIQVAPGSHAESLREHKSQPSLRALPWEASSAPTKWSADEPSPASATAQEGESFGAKSADAARSGSRKNGTEGQPSRRVNGEHDLWSRQAAGQGLVSIHEAAKLLAVSVSSLYGWVWQRKIAFVKMGRAVRFELPVLRDFIDQSRVPPRSITKF